VKNLSLFLAGLLLLLAPVPQPAVRAQTPSSAQSQPRARDLGVPFDGTPGPLNAITDVPGVEVGFKTLIAGEGRLIVGKGPVRTGPAPDNEIHRRNLDTIQALEVNSSQ
jgi:hypothetical protein